MLREVVNDVSVEVGVFWLGVDCLFVLIGMLVYFDIKNGLIIDVVVLGLFVSCVGLVEYDIFIEFNEMLLWDVE